MRLKISLTGLIQGVGFRPFIHRLASEMSLAGYVQNDSSGVTIETEGNKASLDAFLLRIERDKPELAKIYTLQFSFLNHTGFCGFEIRPSAEGTKKITPVLPDIAICAECQSEIESPDDRRSGYAFTNCTNCGPRYTIITEIPYDRPNTTMAEFNMCAACEKEYTDPDDRRFHAQPIACPECGPDLSLFSIAGKLICKDKEALAKISHIILQGGIIAVKGLGGFHLLCDATNEDAVTDLRKKKKRDEKPMAVMFPSIEGIKKTFNIDALHEQILCSTAKPVLLLGRKPSNILAPSVSLDNDSVGVFLPYTPLHHLLLKILNRPVVATSANLTDEPIIMGDDEAFAGLREIASHILTHERKIQRRCDDSVVKLIAGKMVPFRRSRGFAPVPIPLAFSLPAPVLALGSQMNCTVALGIEDRVYISQHIGDIDSTQTEAFYEETVNDLLKLFNTTPDIVISDMHPGYYSTRYGERYFKEKLNKVQHHYAHILSCMAENSLGNDREVIGIAFDGTGHGTDGTIWGSEIMTASYKGFIRKFHLLPFQLPGGDMAIKDPRRTAFSLLYSAFKKDAQNRAGDLLSAKEQIFLTEMLNKNIRSPLTSSMGRLFDGIAFILGLRRQVSYNAQAAILLEQQAARAVTTEYYDFNLRGEIIDHLPIIRGVVNDRDSGIQICTISRKFHNSIALIIRDTAKLIREETGIKEVVLSGGVFQNAELLLMTLNLLQDSGFKPLVHQLVPPNDGGLSLGQVVSSLGFINST